MNPTRFDRWTRMLPQTGTRRAALAALVVLPALIGRSDAQAKHHHKKACTGGAVRCGKSCCAADDRCVQGTCYCGAGAQSAGGGRLHANAELRRGGRWLGPLRLRGRDRGRLLRRAHRLGLSVRDDGRGRAGLHPPRSAGLFLPAVRRRRGLRAGLRVRRPRARDRLQQRRQRLFPDPPVLLLALRPDPTASPGNATSAAVAQTTLSATRGEVVWHAEVW